ncbi:MAG: response regulator transcription factor, partial [Ilumatobacteraceae bacterium]
ANDIARRYVQRALAQAHEEESYLLVGTRCADAVATLGDRGLAEAVIEMLTPWSAHVSVDSSGWWCDGPVSLWLAQLHLTAADRNRAAELLDVGAPVAQALNDVRSLRRVDDLSGRLGNVVAATAHDLTKRELAVLARMATGATNPQIAAALSYSLSTIRVDTMSIYRKLGVTGRAEAVALAVKLGLHET